MAAELQEYADQRGVRFGMPYYSDWWYTSDKQWFDDVQAGVLSYEVEHGMRPDDALFQSWNPFPRHVLPEGANYTFTHLLDLYLRQRTYIAMNAQTSDGRSASASGTLKGFDGEPLGHSAVTVYERALSEASYHGYVMSGTFPLGTVSALMILTLNPPNGCSGVNDFSLYNITFRQGLDPANLAPNYNFGIDSINGGGWDWSTWGNGTAEVVPSDSGGGRMLHLATNVSTTVGLISRGIQVTGGLNYTAVFFTKVALDSSGCDIFEIHFFSDPGGTWGCCHLGEDVIFPEPPETVAGSQSTDVSGFFSQEYFPAANGSSVLTAFYGGDSEHWPTQTEFSVGAWNLTSVRFKDAHPYTVSFHIPYNGRNAVGILTNSTNVSGFTFSPQGKSIRFVVDGNTGTEGYARISIPSSLMGGPFSASIDGVDWPMEQVPSADGTILTLHYHHSVHTIAIFAASVSPPSTTTAVSTQQAPTSSFTSAASSTNPGASSTVTTTSPGSGSSAGVRVENLLYDVGGIALAVIAATLTVVLRKRR